AWLVLWFFVSRRADVRNWKPLRPGGPPAALRFTDLRVWSFVLAYGLGATPLGFVMYAAAIYLNQALGKDQAVIGKVRWIPPLGWEIGYFFWGWMVDRMTSRGVPKMATVQRLMLSAVFLSLPLAGVPWISLTWLALLGMFLAMFVIVGFVVPSVAYATHLYPAEHSGLIAGICAGSYRSIVPLT